MCPHSSAMKCLNILIRARKAFFGFWSADCRGNTSLETRQWYHLAFVYDYATKMQFIYLNGSIDCIRSNVGPFLGSEGKLLVGAITRSAWLSQNIHFWTGYIDQLSYVSRAKSIAEILRDATLMAHYSFDDPQNLHLDSGPNGINGVSCSDWNERMC